MRGGGDGMFGEDGLVVAEIAVDEALDQFVALRIEAAFGAGLRDAVALNWPSQR